jgi:hypothetical protein
LKDLTFAITNIKPQPNGNGAAVAVKKGTAAPPVTEGEVDWMSEIQVYRMILGYRNKGAPDCQDESYQGTKG